MTTVKEATHVLPLSDARATSPALTGGKGANLARLIAAGLPVPGGFCVTTATFNVLLDNDIRALTDDLEAIDPADLEAQQELAAELRDRIRDVVLPEPTTGAIAKLIDALESPGAPLDVDLDRRRAEHERHHLLRAPGVIASDGEIPRGVAAPIEDGKGMVGIATAGGVAEGGRTRDPQPGTSPA